MMEFCKEIAENCFTNDGSFIPEIMDFAIKSGVLTRYANFRLPENLEEQYRLIYNTDAYETVVRRINTDQLNEIVRAANMKIKYLCDSDVLAFRAKMEELIGLSGNFSQPLPQATVIFFPAGHATTATQSTTKLYYGASVKVERALQVAFGAASGSTPGANAFPTAMVGTDGNNVGDGLSIAALDTTNKVVTVRRSTAGTSGHTTTGLVANQVSTTSGIFNLALSAPKTFMDVTISAAKTAATTLLGAADTRIRQFHTDVVGCKITGGAALGTTDSRTITAASRSAVTTNPTLAANARIQLTLDSEDSASNPINAVSAHNAWIIRRVPGQSTHATSNNKGMSIYNVLGRQTSFAPNCGIKVYSASVSTNAGSTIYLAYNDYYGLKPNQHNGRICDPLVSSNIGTTIYLDIRLNSLSGTNCKVGQARLYNNSVTGGDVYLILASHVSVLRQVQIYRNQSPYRIRQSATIAGVPISQATAPRCQALIAYDNITDILYFENINIDSKPLADHGSALLVYGARIYNNNVARCYFNNANVWINITNSEAASVTAPAQGIEVYDQPNFEMNHAVVIQTAAAANKFGASFRNIDNLKIRSLLSGSTDQIRMLFWWTVTGVVSDDVNLGAIGTGGLVWRVTPDKQFPAATTVTSVTQGLGPNVALIQNKAFIT